MPQLQFGISAAAGGCYPVTTHNSIDIISWARVTVLQILHGVDFNETISEKYKAKVSKNRISSPMRCVWCYNSMGMLCKSVSYLRKHTLSLTLGVPGSECLLIPVHSRAVADVMVSMYRTEHINVLKSPKPIWTCINKFWCSGNPCHSNAAIVQSVFVIRRLSYNHADSLIPFRW